MNGWTCRHQKTLPACTLCHYELPAHMREYAGNPQRLDQAQHFLDLQQKSIRTFGGGRKFERVKVVQFDCRGCGSCFESFRELKAHAHACDVKLAGKRVH